MLMRSTVTGLGFSAFHLLDAHLERFDRGAGFLRQLVRDLGDVDGDIDPVTAMLPVLRGRFRQTEQRDRHQVRGVLGCRGAGGWTTARSTCPPEPCIPRCIGSNGPG